MVGGQPLLIVGVAEPIVLTYSYMYDFAKDKDDLGARTPPTNVSFASQPGWRKRNCSSRRVVLKFVSTAGPDLFLAWAAWTCMWAAVMILMLAAAGACRYIHLFTRFSGELFGALIAVRIAGPTTDEKLTKGCR